MHIGIHDNARIGDIEKAFSDFYPYLQIRFYEKKHDKYEASDERDRISPDKLISDIKKTHVSGILEMRPEFTVADVEREFLQRFGLSVQIIWNKNDRWEQTTGVDDFTLTGLNEMARSFSGTYILEDLDEDPEDLPTPSDFR